MLRWNEDVTYKFVKIFLNHEYLWNRYHDYHRIQSKRDSAYKDIINKFKATTGITITKPELRLKIRNLGSTYRQELAKIRQRSSASWTYVPTLKWFADWHKCLNKVEDLNLVTLYDDKDNGDLNNEVDLQEDIIWATNSTEEDVSSTPLEHKIVMKQDPVDGTCAEDSTNMNKSISKIMKDTDNFYKVQSSLSSNDSTDIEDEFDIYGKYIASQLRAMDLEKALKIQMQIQTLVSEVRISNMEGKK